MAAEKKKKSCKKMLSVMGGGTPKGEEKEGVKISRGIFHFEEVYECLFV